MTKGNGKLRSLLLRVAACLVMAFAIGAMASGAHAGEGDGGKGHDGHERDHEAKRITRQDREFGLREFIDRIEGNHPSPGSTSGGDGSGKASYGSCSRC
jgi:hypothetical protein